MFSTSREFIRNSRYKAHSQLSTNRIVDVGRHSLFTSTTIAAETHGNDSLYQTSKSIGLPSISMFREESKKATAEEEPKVHNRFAIPSQDTLFMKNPIVRSAMLSQNLDQTANVTEEKLVSSEEFDKIAALTLKPAAGATISRTCFVVKPVLVPESVANIKKPEPKSKSKQQKQIYLQMLQNHAKPPGPFNRGMRSALSWDKRPLRTQILQTLSDTKPYRADGREFQECRDFLATNGENIDDLFYERDMVQVFEDMTDENGKYKPVTEV